MRTHLLRAKPTPNIGDILRSFVVLATLGTLAACNTTGTTPTTTPNPDATLGDQVGSPTDGFETDTGVD